MESTAQSEGQAMRQTVADAVHESRVTKAVLHGKYEDFDPTLRQVIEFAPDGFEAPECGHFIAAYRKARSNGGNVAEYVEDQWAATFEIFRTSIEAELPSDVIRDAKRILNRACKQRLQNALTSIEAAPSQASEIFRRLRNLELDNVSSLPAARELSALIRHGRNDPRELLQFRFLCRRGFMLLCGPTGIGKSSLAIQCMILWALGLPTLGIFPTRAIKSLLIQAENDDGDLAEMRDGVIAGLNLTPEQAQQAMANVIVLQEEKRTGIRFFAETVRPLLARHKPDLLCIDPALAYLGGENNSQEAVGGFLRNMLNPLLHEFDCAGLVIHHTNKPATGKEKADWQAGDFAYLGAGSAEWANAARAVLALRSVGSHEVFELRAGKRGGRLGWQQADGSMAFSKYIAHDKRPGVICWHEVGAGEVQQGGRPKTIDPEEMLALLPPEGLTAGE